jgi:hypothetical protein
MERGQYVLPLLKVEHIESLHDCGEIWGTDKFLALRKPRSGSVMWLDGLHRLWLYNQNRFNCV